MNILALDLGTRCGWALREHGRIESGVQDFSLKRGESPGWRFLKFNRWLGEVALSPPPVGGTYTCRFDVVIYEQSHNRGGAATEVAAGFTTRVQEFCARWDIEHAAVHTATLKKFTTGSGRGDKNDMRDHAIARGWLEDMVAGRRDGYDDNEVDAIALLHYALAEIAPANSTSATPAPQPSDRRAVAAPQEPSRGDENGRGA